MGEIQGFIDAHKAVIGLVILVAMFIAFLRERYPVAVVALLGACAYLATGLLDVEGLFSVFSNSAPIVIGVMFILSGALIRTGTIDAIASAIVARAEKYPRLAIVEVFAGALIASAFLNNTPVVVVLIPIMFRLAAATGVPVKRLLMPLSIVAILGGSMTLIGTSTNLVVDGIARNEGLEPFGIFEITPYAGIAALAGCVVLLLLAQILLPSDPLAAEQEGGMAEDQDYLTELAVRSDSALIGKPMGELPGFRGRTRLIGVKRGGELIRRQLAVMELKPGDRLVVRASGVELLTLRDSKDFDIGLTGLAGPSAAKGAAVEAMISPAHPSVGQRLADIPFLQRLRVRVLGVTRHRHLPGPDLANARMRAADRLLVVGEDDAIRGLRENPNLLGVGLARMRAFRRDRAPIAIGALAATVLLAAFDIMPISVAAILALGVILATRCIDPEEAWGSIDGNVLILIFAMLAVGLALQKAGSVALMVDWVTPLIRDAPPWMLLFIVYAFTLLLSELLSNNAVAAIMTPIAIEMSRDLGIDPRPLVIVVMISASACFATPIGYQTNALVYAAGDYRFADFVRIGIPLNLVVGSAACLALTALY